MQHFLASTYGCTILTFAQWDGECEVYEVLTRFGDFIRADSAALLLSALTERETCPSVSAAA